MFAETKFFHKAGEGSGGGSDPHNLGYYADLTALQTARPTGIDGDFAILGSTDTIWVWDSGTSAWKDTDTKGQVTSVNGQTGAVTVDAGQTIQYDTMPTASAETVGKIVQYIGATDSTYRQGCFYRGYSNQSGGQTYYGWGYITPVKDISAGDFVFVGNGATKIGTYTYYNIAIGHNAKASGYAMAIGQNAYNDGGILAIGTGARVTATGAIKLGNGDSTRLASGQYSLAVGNYASTTANYAIGIGFCAYATAVRAIQLGEGTNNTPNTFSVGLSDSNNYRLLNSDGTIPKERLTNVVTTPSTAPVLAVADWSSNTQTITVTGVTATNTVFVAPAPASAADYAAAGILCTAQAADSLTFTCTTVPTNAITLSVVILG